METIKNDQITIAVKDHGAELSSIVHNGREYLWQADEAFWKRHSPVLFPIVGSVWDGELRINGKTYKMGQHGFARDMDFELISKTEDELRYRLTSSPQSLEKYPYNFILEIGYKITDSRIKVIWQVKNSGSEPMPFQIGAHPAFYWPMLNEATIQAGVEAMEVPLNSTDKRGYFKIESKSNTLTKSVITEKGCFGGSTEVTIDEDGYMPLLVETFGRDALVFEDSQITKVTLCDDDKKALLSLEFDSPAVGLWSPPGKRAPFVCIEPWYGRADSAHYDGEFKDKKWMQQLNAGQVFDASYDIVIES